LVQPYPLTSGIHDSSAQANGTDILNTSCNTVN